MYANDPRTDKRMPREGFQLLQDKLGDDLKDNLQGQHLSRKRVDTLQGWGILSSPYYLVYNIRNSFTDPQGKRERYKFSFCILTKCTQKGRVLPASQGNRNGPHYVTGYIGPGEEAAGTWPATVSHTSYREQSLLSVASGTY